MLTFWRSKPKMELCKRMLDDTQARVLKALEAMLRPQVLICPGVALERLVSSTGNGMKTQGIQGSVDVLLCDQHGLPLCGIDIVGDRNEFPNRVQRTLREINLPHVIVREQTSGDRHQLRARLAVEGKLPDEMFRNTESTAPQRPRRSHIRATPGEAVRCPKCAGPMTLKRHKHPPRAGQPFWGCRRFPTCKGKRFVDRRAPEPELRDRPKSRPKAAAGKPQASSGGPPSENAPTLDERARDGKGST